jgi:hypothetical protein
MSPSRCVNFLDLTVRIMPVGLITTRTFQKPMNLYLYRPPSLAQPPSILYGLIFRTLHRYFWQNSDRSDMEHFTNLFFKRLQRRSHTAATLVPLFQKAAARVDTSSMPVPRLGPLGPQYNQAETFFLHLPFHPQDPSRTDIQQIFDETLRLALEDAPIGTNRMTIADSRAPNIGDTVRRNHPPPYFQYFCTWVSTFTFTLKLLALFLDLSQWNRYAVPGLKPIKMFFTEGTRKLRQTRHSNSPFPRKTSQPLIMLLLAGSKIDPT